MNNFHALLAQVIPVLLLAAAFESKVLQRVPMRYGSRRDPSETETESRVAWDTNIFQSIGMGVSIGFIGIGEAVAIWCVYTGHNLPWQNAWVLLAGLAALVLVIGPLVSLHYEDCMKTIRILGEGWKMMLWIVIVLIGIAACLLWLVLFVGNYVPTNPG